MCGRFVSATPVDQLAAFFGAAAPQEPLDENHNVAPTTSVYGVVPGDVSRAIEVFRWGLVPVWADDPKIGSRMINARAETIFDKPAFRSLITRRRIVVPMTGFYEWRTDGEGKAALKTPMFIHRADGMPLAIAGIETAWRPKDAVPDTPWMRTCSVITTEANTTMSPVHDRMPVILEPHQWDTWLDPKVVDRDTIGTMLRPAAADVLTMYQVGNAVNSVRNKGADLMRPV